MIVLRVKGLAAILTVLSHGKQHRAVLAAGAVPDDFGILVGDALGAAACDALGGVLAGDRLDISDGDLLEAVHSRVEDVLAVLTARRGCVQPGPMATD